MSQDIIAVSLARDGPGTAWGFRLQGGRDVGCPLTIQRVFLGSPAEGEVHRGDVILRIGDKDANRLSHMEAHDAIRSSGNNLKLVLQRMPGRPLSPAITPTSPSLAGKIHPLANLPTTPPPPRSQPWNKAPDFSSCLPVTPMHNYVPVYRPNPQTPAGVEEFEFKEEQTREMQSIVHQGYRTLPLISPKPKTHHDLPIGSYLRHVQDPTWKSQAQPRPAAYRVPPSFALSSQGQSAEADRPQVVHTQYNSPLNLYSAQNVAETISEQTGFQPSRRSPSSGGSPSYSGPSPARAGTKLHNIVDITMSPTFRMLQETEEDRPVARTVYRRTVAVSHPHHIDDMNAFGMPKERIHQSGSFKTLMTSLVGQSDF